MTVNKSKKVLCLCYFFPPISSAGTQRCSKFVKYLPKFGYQPIVVTTYSACLPGHYDSSLLKDIHPQLEVYRIPDFSYWTNILLAILKKLLSPDAQFGWSKRALKKAKKLIKQQNISLLFTSSFPYSSHLAGLELKKKFPDVQWIADFRDEWTNNPYYLDHNSDPEIQKKQKMEKEMEKEVLTSADHIICITGIMKNNFISLNPTLHLSKNKFSVIPNGYDSEDIERTKGGQPLPGIMTFLHTGTFYGTRQQPTIFLKAVDSLLEKKIIPADKIRVQFIGKCLLDNEAKQLVSKLPVRIMDAMTHDECLLAQNESDILLLILGAGKNSKSIFSGKIFEYIAKNKPILSICHPRGVAANTIRNTRTGWIADHESQQDVEDKIKDIFHLWQAGKLKVNPDWNKIRQYERQHLTEKLSHVFDRVLSSQEALL